MRRPRWCLISKSALQLALVMRRRGFSRTYLVNSETNRNSSSSVISLTFLFGLMLVTLQMWKAVVKPMPEIAIIMANAMCLFRGISLPARRRRRMAKAARAWLLLEATVEAVTARAKVPAAPRAKGEAKEDPGVARFAPRGEGEGCAAAWKPLSCSGAGLELRGAPPYRKAAGTRATASTPTAASAAARSEAHRAIASDFPVAPTEKRRVGQ
mmetsp:Transcript_102769/g.261086  ORF Transcript_102769/g.261086 Transcript_102769/m.261086 type:complete len:212 (+) Transcript_102769:169-804(+)